MLLPRRCARRASQFLAHESEVVIAGLIDPPAVSADDSEFVRTLFSPGFDHGKTVFSPVDPKNAKTGDYMKLTGERETLLAPLQAVIKFGGLGETPETARKTVVDDRNRGTMLIRASGTMN